MALILLLVYFYMRLKIFSYLNHHFSLTTSIRKKYVIGTYYSKSLLLYILLLIWLMKKDHKINFSHISLHKNLVSLFHMYKYMLLWYKVCHFWTLQTLIYGWLVFNPLQELFHRKEREGFEELNFSIEGIVLHKMLIALIFLEIELWIME